MAIGGVKIHIPPLAYHPGQQRLLSERKRFNVACMGRRFGKTLFGLEQILFEPGGAIDGKPVAWFAPTYQLLLEVWKDAERSLRPVTRKANKTENRIELITGGTVYRLSNRMDGGDILAQDYVFIRPGDDAETLWRRDLSPLGVRLLTEVVSRVAAEGYLPGKPQDEALATFEPSWERPPVYRPDLIMIGTR